jgi:hypothetical protein
MLEFAEIVHVLYENEIKWAKDILYRFDDYTLRPSLKPTSRLNAAISIKNRALTENRWL